MKIGVVSQTDAGGGAGLAAARLHRGLRQAGFDSRMLVAARSGQSDVFTGALPQAGRVMRLGERALGYLLPKAGLGNLSSLSSFRWAKQPQFAGVDVLNFHNLHGNFFSYMALPRLAAFRPAVLTLHDMWSFTGHCIYSFDCERWKSGCGVCPYPEIYPAIRRDATALEWKLKKRAFTHSRVTIIAISRWIERLVRQSLLGECRIEWIPNGIDLKVFRPLDQRMCRDLLGLPQDRLLVLFAAADMADKRKGGDLLSEALLRLPEALRAKISLVIMGKTKRDTAQGHGMQTFELGYIHDDLLKTQVFSAADLFVFPTRADNLPLVLQESMACGTPLVSFNVGGVPDLVRPGITGLLAEAEDCVGFARHIQALLEDNDLRRKLGHSCRKIAEAEYDVVLQARRYGELFAELLTPSRVPEQL